MKTYPIPVLLAGLPKGIAEKAVKNCEIYDKWIEQKFDVKVEYAFMALGNGFDWIRTKEGFGEWSTVYQQLIKLKL